MQQLCLLFDSGEHLPKDIINSVEKLNINLFIVYVENDSDNSYFNELNDSNKKIVSVKNHRDIVVTVLEQHKKKEINGMLPCSEKVIATSSKIAELINVPANTYKSIVKTENKYLQRKSLKDHRLPIPKFIGIFTESDLVSAVEYIGFPSILKPNKGSGGAYVQLINNIDELKDAYLVNQNIIKHLNQENELPSFILEEVMAGVNYHGNNIYGDYASVEVLIEENNLYTLCITDRMPLEYPFRETGYLVPSNLSNEYQKLISDVAKKAVRALSLTFGVIEVEVKFTKNGPFIIEVNPRTGAGTPIRLQLSSEYDLFYELAKLALGEKIKKNIVFTNVSGSILLQPPYDKSKVVKLIDYNIANPVKDVDYKFLIDEGEPIAPLLGAHSAIGYAYIKGKTHSEVFDKSKILKSRIYLEYSDD